MYIKIGSPAWLIERTFTNCIYFKQDLIKVNKIQRKYQNSILLAKEYKRMINTGEAKSESDLARKLGFSRVRVNQIIRLLQLDSEIIELIERLGDPMPKPYITERYLRCLMSKPFERQILTDKILKISL